MAHRKVRKSKYSLRTRKSTAGLGLFSEEIIPRGAFVIEYFGSIISGQEANENGGKYLFEINKKTVINGVSRKNIARYINHSCKPNCYAEVDGKRVFIFTRRKIYPGEELSYNYGKEYFDDVIKPLGCKCNHCTTKKK